MLGLILSALAALLGFKHLNDISNSSVVKAEFSMGSLRDMKYTLWFIETGGFFQPKRDLHYRKKS